MGLNHGVSEEPHAISEWVFFVGSTRINFSQFSLVFQGLVPYGNMTSAADPFC